MRLKKYVRVDGNWYRAKCESCGKLLKGIYANKCRACWANDRKGRVWVVHNKPHSEATKDLLRKIKSKDELGYNGVHNWLRREFGPADKCLNKLCELKSSKYNWAKLHDYDYIKKKEAYTQLCSSCHIKYDRWDYDIKL